MTDQAQEMAATIVASYVSNNEIPKDEVPDFIRSIIGAFDNPGPSKKSKKAQVKPAVPIEKSYTDEHIICLECGRDLKMLKRHLDSHGLTFEEYKLKYGLKQDYPMTASKYSEKRRGLAKKSGLGTSRKKNPKGSPKKKK